MKVHLPVLAGAALTLLLSGTAQAEVKDPAALLPARTIAYLEFTQPAKLAKEVRALLKGSALDRMPEVMVKFREKHKNLGFGMFSAYQVALLGTYVGPEMLTEIGRIQGGAVAITGVAKDGKPEVTGILLPGKSTIPGLSMRSLLISMPMFQDFVVTKVEGVHVYQQRYAMKSRFKGDRKDKNSKGEEKEEYRYGTAYAMLPGVIVVGSNAATVSDVIRRARGKKVGESLADVEAFKDAAKLRDQPGLFGYADVATAVPMLASTMMGQHASKGRPIDKGEKKNIFKDKKGDGEKKDGAKGEGDKRKEDNGNGVKRKGNDPAKAAKELAAQFKGFGPAFGSLALQNGDVSLTLRINLDPKQKSLAMDLLPQRKVNVELLHFVPADSLFAGVRSADHGAKRWAKSLELMDKISGSQMVTEVIAALEKKAGVDIGKDFAGNLAGGGFAFLSAPGHHSKAGPGVPSLVMILEAKDDKALKALQATLPKLYRLAAVRWEDGEFQLGKVGSKSLTVQEQKLRQLTAGGPFLPSLVYGSHGRVIVVGPDAKLVAEALIAGAARKGVLGDERVAAVVKDLDEPVGVGILSLKQILVQVLLHEANERPRFKVEPKEGRDKPSRDGKDGNKKGKEEKREGPDSKSPHQEFVKLAKDYARKLAKVTEPLPPLIISATRKADHLALEARQTGLKAVSVGIIDILVHWQLERSVSNPRFGGDRKEVKEEGGKIDSPAHPVKDKKDKDEKKKD